jgi:hypothetical protein
MGLCGLCSEFARLRPSFVLPERGQRGRRRRLARAGRRLEEVEGEGEEEGGAALRGEREEERGMEEERSAAAESGSVEPSERVEVSLSGRRTVEGRLTGVTFGLNAVTRTLEAALSSTSLPPSSPFSLLLSTSSTPPSLTSHFTHFSHHLHLPLLTLHPSISSTRLAHALSPSLSSLIALAFHLPSSPSSPLLPLLLPFGRVLRVPWLECEGGFERWRGLRVERGVRTVEREAREAAKRRRREEEVKKSRPLSPKSIAANVWKEKEKAKKVAEQSPPAHPSAEPLLSTPAPPSQS